MGQPPVSAPRSKLPVAPELLLERMHLDDVAALVVGWEDNAIPELPPASPASSSAVTVRPRRAA